MDNFHICTQNSVGAMYQHTVSFFVHLIFALIFSIPCVKTAEFGLIGCSCKTANITDSTYALKDALLVATAKGLYQRPSNYGSYCHDWDRTLQPDCNLESPPNWCRNRWCYVDRSVCNVTNKPSVWLPGLGLHFSYETCGSPHEYGFTKGDLEKGLRGKKLRWAFPKSSHPWHFKLPNGQWDGVMWHWLMLLQQHAEFELEEHNVSQSSLNLYPNNWDACVNDIYKGLLDVCPTAAWTTTFRAERATFASPVIWSNFKLLVKQHVKEDDGFHIAAPFDPFEPILYVALVCVVFCTSCSFWALEGDPDGSPTSFLDNHKKEEDNDNLEANQSMDGIISSQPSESGSSSVSRRLSQVGKDVAVTALKSLPSSERNVLAEKSCLRGTRTCVGRLSSHLFYTSMGVFTAGSEMPARSLPGRFLKLFFTFFMLVVISSYTANLAAFLVMGEAVVAGISNIEECVSQNLKVCVADQILDPVRRLQPNLNIVNKPDSKNTMLGVPNGECDGALVPDHDYYARADFQRCGEGLVGRELMGMAVATPTSPSILNSYSYYTIALHQQGYFEELLRRYQSTFLQTCKEEASESESHKLGFRHFIGLLALYGMGVGLAWAIWILTPWVKYCCQTGALKKRGEQQREMLLQISMDMSARLSNMEKSMHRISMDLMASQEAASRQISPEQEDSLVAQPDHVVMVDDLESNSSKIRL